MALSSSNTVLAAVTWATRRRLTYDIILPLATLRPTVALRQHHWLSIIAGRSNLHLVRLMLVGWTPYKS